MIQKTLTAYCDECTLSAPLLSQTLKEAAIELSNKGWEIDKYKRHFCPTCSLRRAQEAATGGSEG